MTTLDGKAPIREIMREYIRQISGIITLMDLAAGNVEQIDVTRIQTESNVDCSGWDVFSVFK